MNTKCVHTSNDNQPNLAGYARLPLPTTALALPDLSDLLLENLAIGCRA